MRPGQNKRMRGRPSNNRRGPNPLTRSYESNGPDVKIRGNAHHVAEKYLQLARDAHTSGDPVAAENYLQHAEHYFRLIAAAQAAQAIAQGQPRPDGDVEEVEDDDDFGGMSDRFASPSERAAYQQPNGFQAQPVAAQPNTPQPFMDRQPYEDRPQQGQNDRGGFQPRQERQPQQGGRFPDRNGQRQPFGERNDNFRDRQNRDNRVREFRPYRDQPPAPRDAAAEGDQPTALPSFITGGPRPAPAAEGEAAPAVETQSAATQPAETAPAFADEGASPEDQPRFPGRGRRRRLRSPYGFNPAQDESGAPEAAPPVADEPPGNE